MLAALVCLLACDEPAPPRESIERVQLLLAHQLGPWFVFDVRSDGSFCGREHDGVLDEYHWYVLREQISPSEFAKLVGPLVKEPLWDREIGRGDPPNLALRVQTSRRTHVFRGRELTHSGAYLVLGHLRDRMRAAWDKSLYADGDAAGRIEVRRTSLRGTQRPDVEARSFTDCIPSGWTEDELRPATEEQLRRWTDPAPTP